jgi:hypothetical protein
LEVSECSIVVYFGEYYAYFLHLDVWFCVMIVRPVACWRVGS